MVAHFYMFSENVDYVLLYRDHRTVAKAPMHNEKKAGQLLTYYDIYFSCTHDSKWAPCLENRSTYSRGATHDFRSVCTSP